MNKDKKDAWLDPDGNMIEVYQCGHNDYASELLEKEFGDFEPLYKYMEDNNLQYPYEVLHERGWVRIKFHPDSKQKVEALGNCISLVQPMRNTIDPPMNEKQLKVVKELCDKYNVPFHIAVNDKRFW